jgi:hypothetical protein
MTGFSSSTVSRKPSIHFMEIILTLLFSDSRYGVSHAQMKLNILRCSNLYVHA